MAKLLAKNELVFLTVFSAELTSFVASAFPSRWIVCSVHITVRTFNIISYFAHNRLWFKPPPRARAGIHVLSCGKEDVRAKGMFTRLPTSQAARIVSGLTGPRGKAGRPGNHGTPGIPGINAWKTKVNGSAELLIPPSIAGEWRASPGRFFPERWPNFEILKATLGLAIRSYLHPEHRTQTRSRPKREHIRGVKIDG